MSRREKIIVELLERYDDLVTTLNGPRGTRGERDSDCLMPTTYNSSVRELERLMVQMREQERTLWWHVNERYIRCRTVVRYELRPKLDKHNRVKRTKGKVVREKVPALVTVYDARVEPPLVVEGVRWLAANWALPHDPELPRAADLTANYQFVA
jgi:hypothetical protein